MHGSQEPSRADHTEAPRIEVREGRTADINGMGVVRVLPTKGRRTVGPWCFVDLMTPADIADPDPMEVGPHPHIGLSTVTWLFEGEALNTDSLGTEQVIRPGELNLMTAGHGIAHAELEVRRGTIGSTADAVKGVQMWLAQTDGTRHGPSSFAHHKDLPRLAAGGAELQVLAGAFGHAASPVTTDWPLVGAEVRVHRGVATVPVDVSFEHAVIPIDRRAKVNEAIVEPGSLAIVSAGTDLLHLETAAPGARLMLLGGRPFPTRIQMWWNFVARNRDELTQAWLDWQNHNDDRFAPVPSRLDRIDAPRPVWVR